MKLIFAIFTTMLAAAGNWWITGELIETALEDVTQNPAELAQQLESESTANESKAYYLEEAEKKIALHKKLKTYTTGQTTMLKVKLSATGAILGFIGFFVIFGLTWAVTKPLEDALDNPVGIFTRYYFTPLVFSLILQYLVIAITLFPMWA